MQRSVEIPESVLERVLARLAAEVADLAARSRALEDRLSVETERPSDVDIQDLDSLTQHLEGTASVLSALSLATCRRQPVNEAWLGRITGALQLQELAARLVGGRPNGDAATRPGECELW